jgi:hypothetical protein
MNVQYTNATTKNVNEAWNAILRIQDHMYHRETIAAGLDLHDKSQPLIWRKASLMGAFVKGIESKKVDPAMFAGLVNWYVLTYIAAAGYRHRYIREARSYARRKASECTGDWQRSQRKDSTRLLRKFKQAMVLAKEAVEAEQTERHNSI